MISINSFAIHVTYTCPLECAHCCFSSSPRNKDSLPIATILESIKSFSGSTVKMIAFTGGEPFLLGSKLDDVVRAAKSIGVTTRVVSSCHWAVTPHIALKKLRSLSDCGLDELSISWDDFHEKFVSFQNIKNAFDAAKSLNITVAISIVQAEHSKWTASGVRDALGLPPDSENVVVESPINLTGRAERELSDAGLRPERVIGPCPYVITGPTLSAKGKLLACCGVIPQTEELIIDHNPTADSIQNSIESARRSVLLNWLHLRGPYAIMKWIGDHYNVDVPPEESIGGNCEACKRLFESENYQKHLPAALCEQTDTISSELFLLEQTGLLDPKILFGLWRGNKPSTNLSTSKLNEGE
jgi:hypothetical protein